MLRPVTSCGESSRCSITLSKADETGTHADDDGGLSRSPRLGDTYIGAVRGIERPESREVR